MKQLKEKLILDENMPNLVSTVENKRDLEIHGEIDDVTAQAYIDSKTATENVDKVFEELRKLADGIAPAEREPKQKLPKNYTTTLTEAAKARIRERVRARNNSKKK